MKLKTTDEIELEIANRMIHGKSCIAKTQKQKRFNALVYEKLISQTVEYMLNEFKTALKKERNERTRTNT